MFRQLRFCATSWLALGQFRPAFALALSVDVPASIPSGASGVVDPDFAGLAFEEASWVRYATDDAGNVNTFSKNLMDSIYSRTGGKPIIRLGGTSADYGKYLPGQTEPALPVAEQNNYQDIGGTTIGPSFWQLAKLFPDATYMVQVPLATTNISETIAWAQSAVAGIGLSQIHSIQLGNEPNGYPSAGLGPPNFQGHLDNQTYEGNYTEYAAAIRKAVALPQKFFTAFDVAADVGDPADAQYVLQVAAVFGLGIDNDMIIKDVSHHYYQNDAGTAADLASGLMTLSLTHQNLDYLKPHIQYLQANHPQIPFIINEIGNSLDATNSYEYQARLGSALWTVEFMLYSLSIGVARFNFQQIMHSGFDLWLPVASAGHAAQVFASYYAFPFVTDVVGKSGKTRIAKLPITNGDSTPNLAAYAAYDNGAAKRLVLANLDYWNKTSSGTTRPVASVAVSVPTGAKTVTVTSLTSPMGAGAAAHSITYAGSKWTYKSMGKEVKGVTKASTEVTVKGGVATIKVPSSEAVIVYM